MRRTAHLLDRFERAQTHGGPVREHLGRALTELSGVLTHRDHRVGAHSLGALGHRRERVGARLLAHLAPDIDVTPTE